MRREKLFTEGEGKVFAWVLAVTMLLSALGASGLELGSPSVPDRPQLDFSVAEARPIVLSQG